MMNCKKLPYAAPSQFPCAFDVETQRFASITRSSSIFRYAICMSQDDVSKVVLDYVAEVPTALLFVDQKLLVATTNNALHVIDILTGDFEMQANILRMERIGISDFFYNKPHGWIIVAGRDGTWAMFSDTEPFRPSKLMPCTIPRYDRVSFSLDGSRAICTDNFSSVVSVHDSVSAALLHRFSPRCTIQSPTWACIEVEKDMYAISSYNHGQIHLTTSRAFLSSSFPQTFCGPQVIGASKTGDIYVREWASHGQLSAVHFFVVRANFVTACVM